MREFNWKEDWYLYVASVFLQCISTLLFYYVLYGLKKPPIEDIKIFCFTLLVILIWGGRSSR